jgi:predicted transcriptional regulator
MRAADVMVKDPMVAMAGAMASEVAIMFRDRNISVVPVVDDHRTRRFLGTLSDRDIVTRCVAAAKHPMHTRADELMRTNTPVVGPGQELDGYLQYADGHGAVAHADIRVRPHAGGDADGHRLWSRRC